MAELDLRMRLLGRFLERTSAPVDRMTPRQLHRARHRPAPRGPVMGALLGRVARGVVIGERRATTRAGSVRLRTYCPPAAPDGTLPVTVWLHGGGWAVGNVEFYDVVCSKLAARAGCVVVSVDYRLAPEDPFPAGVEDCVDAVAWVAAHPGALVDGLTVDTSRLVLAGDSAGGNLAAVVTQHARDAGGPRVAATALVYPGTDATLASPSLDANALAPLLTRRDVEAFVTTYLQGADPADPRVSPLLAADLSGLPPTLVQTAEHDPIRDDGRRYADALREAGVSVRHTDYAGMAHGFLVLPGFCRSAGQAMDELCTWVADHLRERAAPHT